MEREKCEWIVREGGVRVESESEECKWRERKREKERERIVSGE